MTNKVQILSIDKVYPTFLSEESDQPYFIITFQYQNGQVGSVSVNELTDNMKNFGYLSTNIEDAKD